MRSLFLIAMLLAFSPGFAHGQAQGQQHFAKGVVVKIEREGQIESSPGVLNDYQEVVLRLLDEKEGGRRILITHGGQFDLQESQKVQVGQKVSLSQAQGPDGEVDYYINEPYRLNALAWFLAAFVALVILVSGRTGLRALLGLGFSLLVIVKGMVPAVAQGRSPFAVSFLGALAIVFVSLYLAHGFRKRTTVALLGILAAVGAAILIALLMMKAALLGGGGSQDAFSLQLANLPNLDLKGLLLGGIIIGTLGVLDDVATTQAATVEELKEANPSLGFAELYRRGMSVGREHIGAVVNTLALAYAGASFPLLLLFHLNRSLPLWVILNNEGFAEEIVRTLAGSSALLLAVPLTTALAAWAFGGSKKSS